MKQAKDYWTVWARRSKSSYGAYMDLELSFARRSRADAADKAADAIRRGDSEAADYYAKEAAALREKTGGTVHYDRYPSDYDVAEFSLTFQANTRGDNSPSDWYAAHVGRADLSAHVARAVSKLAKLGRNVTPQAAIAAMKARPVTYASGPGVYVDADISADLVSPLDEQKESAAEDAA